MNYKPLIFATIALVTLGWMALDRTHITADNAEITNHFARAPDVTFARLDGGTIALRALQGHPVWLHFWASWCAPCRAEFGGLLQRIAADRDGTILLAVSADADAGDAKRFLAPYEKQFRELFNSGRVILARDPDRTIIEGSFQTFQYPETIRIAPDLTMRQKIAGMVPTPQE